MTLWWRNEKGETPVVSSNQDTFVRAESPRWKFKFLFHSAVISRYLKWRLTDSPLLWFIHKFYIAIKMRRWKTSNADEGISISNSNSKPWWYICFPQMCLTRIGEQEARRIQKLSWRDVYAITLRKSSDLFPLIHHRLPYPSNARTIQSRSWWV